MDVDEAMFATLVQRHRRELQAHCYRMLGSLEDSEDLVQETFLRAWRARGSFRREGRWSFRAWLYRIATNACLDFLARRAPRVLPPDVARAADPEAPLPPEAPDVPWLEPYPDQLLDPHEAMVARETMEIAFLAAIQHLPTRQRAVLILRDVAGFSAKETAALLDMTVAAANSALQRARATMRRRLPSRRLEWVLSADPSAEERAVLRRYLDAQERGDAEALAAVLRDDLRISFPPLPLWYDGRDAFKRGSDKYALPGDYRFLPAQANGQPTVAIYLRAPGDDLYRPLVLEVLRIEADQVVEIIDFSRPDLFPAFGLPMSFPPPRRSNEDDVEAKEVR